MVLIKKACNKYMNERFDVNLDMPELAVGVGQVATVREDRDVVLFALCLQLSCGLSRE